MSIKWTDLTASPNPKNKFKAFLPVIVLILLLILLPLGIYLVKQPQIFKPKAVTEDQAGTNYNSGVLVIKYFPLDASGQNLDAAITGVNQPLSQIRIYVNDLTKQGITQMTIGTKFHGYKDPSALSAINYQVVDTKEYLEALPVSVNKVPWNPAMYRPDYRKILTRENICDYVDNKNVKQIWLWGYHYGNIEPVEADMAMGTASQSYWNYPGYGDVSNSEQTNDLPTCNKTYTLYNYNYDRGLGEMLEDHGHQIEAVFKFVDSTLWDKFQKPNGDTNPQVINHCGWTHSPPNSGDGGGDRGQYDWNDKTIVKSDCEDWQPDGGGMVKETNCNNWYEPFYNKSYADISCQEDSGVAFKIWWMQNIPGKNNTLTYQGKPLRNWWDFYADFDTAISLGKSLTINRKPENSDLPRGRGDGNGDGIIDWADLSVLYSNFFKKNSELDLNSDGVVNSIDYTLLIEIFKDRGVIKAVGGAAQKRCKSDSECLGGYVCDPTESSGSCDTVGNCDLQIISGVCKKAEGQSCVQDGECSSSKGLICESNFCKTRVSQNCSGPGDTSCPVNYSCIENCGPPVSREDDPLPGYSCARTGSYDPVAGKRRNCPICLSSNTGILTLGGEVNVTEIREGMEVYSVNYKGKIIISKVIKTVKTPAPLSHKVVNLELKDGRRLSVSPNHPSVSGPVVGDFKEGDEYDGSVITGTGRVLYSGAFTYDLLPDSETGFYIANGILMASTLK